MFRPRKGSFYTSWLGSGYIKSNPNAEVYTLTSSATNQPYGSYEMATLDTVNQAIALAQEAQASWARKMPIERGRILLETARLLRLKTAEISYVEALNTSRTISEILLTDVASAADCFEYFGGSVSSQQVGETHQFANSNFAYTKREPLGVTAGIGAFNYPLQSASWKCAPSLAFGNAMIFKPAEDTPQSALLLAETLSEAGLPAGLFSVLLGRGSVIGDALVKDARVTKISFTGSVATGSHIASEAGKQVKKVTLELGGKSPLIVFADCDLDQAVIGALWANFYSNGQVCSNGTRIFVQEAIYSEFVRRLVKRVKALRIGDPLLYGSELGPLIHHKHLQRVLDYCSRAEAEGAKLECGGRRIEDASEFFPDDNEQLLPGAFMSPCVFSNVTDDMEIAREEVFGPVASVLSFCTEEEVIRRANQSPFGLGAGVFTGDIKLAHRVVNQLEAGCCWINHYNLAPVELPWGGYKLSGLGRENGTEALHYWTQTKSVYVECGQQKIADPFPRL